MNEGHLISKWIKRGKINKRDFGLLDKNHFKSLMDGKFIIDINKDESVIIKNRFKRLKKKFYEKGVFLLTIAPTNLCNMECKYCFLGSKIPENGEKRMKDETIDALIKFIEKEINNNIVKNFKKIAVTWYGGEATLQTGIIKELSDKLTSFSKNNNLDYSSTLITNGTLLTHKTWELLKNHNISPIQVTIDGNRKTHNQLRPFNRNQKSYDIILENLKNIPKEINLSIRINSDKKVVQYLEELLIDLEQYGIWPQKAKQVKINLARKRLYDNIHIQDTDPFFTVEEFYIEEKKFRELKLSYYNKWASRNDKKPAKMAFTYPKKESPYCNLTHHPYGLTIDQNGYIFKCWEHINNKDARIQHISENFNLSKYKEFINFEKTSDSECSQCKALPICSASCTIQLNDDNQEKDCTVWKFQLEDRLKEQYLMLIDEPEKIHSFKKIKGVVTKKQLKEK